MRLPTLLASILWITTSSAHADVLIVDPSGSQGYADVQVAVDAAQDGDLILVRSGTYAGFVLDQRSLAVVADVNASVAITSSVTVTGTPAGSTVVLASLEVTGNVISSGSAAETALVLEDNLGFVRIEDCSLRGGGAPFFTGQVGSKGGDGCQVRGSLRVAMARCTFLGAKGGGDSISTGQGGLGGIALESEGSSVALYDCELVGGTGGDADIYVPNVGGMGGAGVHVVDFGVFFSNTTVRGGGGGIAGVGGEGGTAVFVDFIGQAQLFDSTLLAGGGGIGATPPNDGPDGLQTDGAGVFSVLPGSARGLSAGRLAAQGSKLVVSIEGQPGDSVWILTAALPAHTPALGLSGLWLAGRSIKLPKTPHALIGPSGSATVALTLPPMAAGIDARTFFLQGFVLDAGRQGFLTGPLHPTLLDCAQLAPDCNASGAFDPCDLLNGTSIDCNGNSVPDECEADCNANGIADECDVASGLSTDLNANGILDECEPQNVTRYVDAAASGGGTGTQFDPFQSIGEGVSASLPGDRVLVADGIYSGPDNRGLSFTGRDIEVLSLNGPANCVIDCEDAGQAFTIQNGESPAARIEGFTILGGNGSSEGGGIRVAYSDPVIRDCVFLDCQATEGGGLYLESSDALLEGCEFLGNRAARGGGLYVQNGAPLVRDCRLVGNVADLAGATNFGGGIYASTVSPLRFSRLELRGNVSATNGGGMYLTLGAVTLDHVLLAGNSANVGAAITLNRCDLALTNSTLTANETLLSGSIWTFNAPSSGQVAAITNCVLWEDPLLTSTIVDVAADFAVTIQSCDVRDGVGAIATEPGSTLNYGPGNFDADPLFADADGLDGDPLTYADNDYRLGALSPCADAGDNGLVPADEFDLDGDLDTLEPIPFDLDGGPRFEDDPAVADTGVGSAPIVDLGPYERP